MRALLFFLIVLYYFGDLLVYFDKPFGYIRIPGRVLSVLYSQWLPGRSDFSLNFTLIRCVHLSIERIRLLFRVKWRLYIFSRTTQHVLVVSNSFEAMMILIALSESLNLLKCWSLNSFSRSLPPLGSTKQKTFSKGCAQLHCFSCRWAKTPT